MSAVQPRIRSRIEKVAGLALHGARAFRRRHELEAVAERSPVARALLAVTHDRFTAGERAVFAEIDRQRAQIYARTDAFEWRIEDPVDASTLPAPVRQVVGVWAKLSSVKPHWGRLLYALVREVRPEVCLELGACFGISGLYIQAAQRHVGRGRFVTFEGSRERAEIARATYRALGFSEQTLVVGDFDRHLEPTLAALGTVDLSFVDGNHRHGPTLRYDALLRRHGRPGSVIVHDDIRWSGEMIDAWRQVSQLPGARAFDVFRIGMIELGSTAPVLEAWLGLSHLR